MKKLLVLLLISTLAAFVFAGCGLLPDDGDGDGDGDGGVTEVTVEIDDAVKIGGKTYVSGGSHDITVTFPAPVENVSASIGICTGDYSKGPGLAELISVPVVLFPNDDRTVWSGSGDFLPGIEILGDSLISLCCASYVYVTSGECEEDVCIEFPVIVDWESPYAVLGVTAECCKEEDPCTEIDTACKVTFKPTDIPCEEAPCGDDCSGVGSWSIAIYDVKDVKPGDCCDLTLCKEPIDFCTGVDCPIECTTKCLKPGEYYVFISLVDKVGNEVEWLNGYSEDYGYNSLFYKLTIEEEGCPSECNVELELMGCRYDYNTGKSFVEPLGRVDVIDIW